MQHPVLDVWFQILTELLSAKLVTLNKSLYFYVPHSSHQQRGSTIKKLCYNALLMVKCVNMRKIFRRVLDIWQTPYMLAAVIIAFHDSFLLGLSQPLGHLLLSHLRVGLSVLVSC